MTVSPGEFPPRVLVTCVLSAISRNYNIFFVLVLSPLIKSPYKTRLERIPGMGSKKSETGGRWSNSTSFQPLTVSVDQCFLLFFHVFFGKE